MVGGTMSKTGNSVILTGNTIKQALDLPLSQEEQRVEDNFATKT